MTLLVNKFTNTYIYVMNTHKVWYIMHPKIFVTKYYY